MQRESATKLQRNLYQLSTTTLKNMFYRTDDMYSIEQERSYENQEVNLTSTLTKQRRIFLLAKGGEYNE